MNLITCVSCFPLLLCHSLAPTQWNTSRRCRPSLKVRAPLEVLFRGTLPPPLLRGLLSLYRLRWKSPAASLWRCARCHGNSVLQTQKTGSKDVQTFSGWAFHQDLRSASLWLKAECTLVLFPLPSSQVLWGGFVNQKEFHVPASERPGHGSVLVQRHSG